MNIGGSGQDMGQVVFNALAGQRFSLALFNACGAEFAGS